MKILSKTRFLLEAGFFAAVICIEKQFDVRGCGSLT